MRDAQRTVLATLAAAVLLVGVFFVPWRVAETGEVEWGPVYLSPASYTYTFATPEGGSSLRYHEEEASIAFGLLAVELGAVLLVGWVAYRVAGQRDEEDGSEAPPAGPAA